MEQAGCNSLRDKRNVEKTVSALSLIFLRNVKRRPLLGFSGRKCLFNSQTNPFQWNYILGTTDLCTEIGKNYTQFIRQFLCDTDRVYITSGLQAWYWFRTCKCNSVIENSSSKGSNRLGAFLIWRRKHSRLPKRCVSLKNYGLDKVQKRSLCQWNLIL